MTTGTKTDIPRYRVFGFRISEKLLEHLRSTSYPDLEFPGVNCVIDESRAHGTSTLEHHTVSVTARSCYGRCIELTIDVQSRGMTKHATFQASVFLHGQREHWQGFVDEDTAGVLTFSGLAQTEQATTA